MNRSFFARALRWPCAKWALAIVTVALSGCSGGGDTEASSGGTKEIQSPTISVAPDQAIVLDGGTTTFSVVASGDEPLRYQWKRNGNDIAGATGASFTTQALTLADSGALFAVAVSNVAGSILSREAKLTVSPVAPIVTVQPASQSALQGQSVVFGVQARGSGPITYQWLRDGVALVNETGGNLTIAAVPLSDNGALFSVRLIGPGGVALSESARLTVTQDPVPPKVTAAPQDTTVSVGEAAGFSVHVSGTAPLVFQWQRNGVEISGATQSKYTTPPTIDADSGALYSVRVSNAAGSVSSTAARLSVVGIQAPVIVTQPVPQTTAIGQSVSFTVVATGSLPLRYQWMRDGAAIGGATGATLNIGPVAAGDDGAQFAVVVSNASGQTIESVPARLTVAPSAIGPLRVDDYLVAGVASDAVGSVIRVFLSITDPLNPGAAKTASQLQRIDAGEVMMPRSYTRNANGELVVGPVPYVYFVQEGKVKRIDLKRGNSQAPVQVSALSNACSLLAAFATTPSASQSWVLVNTLESLGGCGSSGPYWVRTDMQAAQAALPSQGSGLNLIYPLIDPKSNALYGWLAYDTRGNPSRLRILLADGSSLAEIENGGAMSVQALPGMRFIAGDSTSLQAIYIAAGREVRRLTWSSSEARLSNALYTYSSNSSLGDSQAASDASGTYFMDNNGGVLLRLRGEQPAELVRAYWPDGVLLPYGLHLTSGAVVLTHRTREGYGISAISKDGLNFTSLARLEISNYGFETLGATSNEIVYAQLSADQIVDIRSVSERGESAKTVAIGAKLIANLPTSSMQRGALGPLSRNLNTSTTIAPSVARLGAVLYCMPASNRKDCVGADIYRYDLPSSSNFRVGRLTDGLVFRSAFQVDFEGFNVQYSLFADMPGTFFVLGRGNGTLPEGGFVSNGVWVDRYLLGAGAAATLTQATKLIP